MEAKATRGTSARHDREGAMVRVVMEEAYVDERKLRPAVRWTLVRCDTKVGRLLRILDSRGEYGVDLVEVDSRFSDSTVVSNFTVVARVQFAGIAMCRVNSGRRSESWRDDAGGQAVA